jgi:hypothetical protein
MLNVLYSDIESERRPATVPTNTAPGTPRIIGGRPAITVTGSGDYAGNAMTVTSSGKTVTLAGGGGGESLAPLEATVTFTGSYFFPVAGASAATVNGTPVFITAGGALTLTSTSNTKYGVVEFFRGESSATDTAVTIGVNLG